MINQPDLIELHKGDSVDHFLLIRRMETRNTRTGSEYLSLELGDKSASLNANIWEGFDKIARSGKAGDIVKVKGTIEEFQNLLQLRVNSIKLSTESDNISARDFLPKSIRDPEEMKTEFLNRAEKISDEHLKTLIKQIFSGKRFENFSAAPAGKSWHHSYIHGLIEHTLEIIKICDLMCDIHPVLNRDILVCGAMLHDLGKTEELSYESNFDYTDSGKLIGHIVIAAIIVKDEINKIPGFPEETEKNLLHLILSHQGKLEYASPVVPKTVEAIALYQADELSAKVNAYKNVISSDQKEDSSWTKFITLAQTDLYKKNLSPGSEDKTNKTLFD